MKKNGTELLIILIISAGLAPLFPSYFKYRDTIAIENFSELIIPFLVIFILLCTLYFSNKTKEKYLKIPDGHQVLYNEQGQIKREGVFKMGELMEGRTYTYNKNGDILDIRIYKNGVCTGNAPRTNDKGQA